MPQPQTTLFTPMINGKPRDKMQIYVEDKEADAIPGITDSGYHTLDRAYELPKDMLENVYLKDMENGEQEGVQCLEFHSKLQ